MAHYCSLSTSTVVGRLHFKEHATAAAALAVPASGITQVIPATPVAAQVLVAITQKQFTQKKLLKS